MTLPLTRDVLAAAYDYLRATPPFNAWNLPEPDDIKFKVVRSPTLRGYYLRDEAGKQVIAMSARNIGHSINVIATMAHEMIHLHQGETNMENGAEHNAAFNKLAARVCKLHGFDPKLF
jgi:hypothetical protein